MPWPAEVLASGAVASRAVRRLAAKTCPCRGSCASLFCGRVVPNEAKAAGAWARTVGRLQRRMRGTDDVAQRMAITVSALEGRPYANNPLVGGPNEPERFVADMRAFDCVTLVESVLALARSRSATGFADELRRTRYKNGDIAWQSRLHYFSDWLRANQRRGAVRIRTAGVGSHLIETRLGTLAGLPERRVRFHVVGKRDLYRALPRLADGSVVAFASVRARLDFFHVGLIFRPSSVQNAGGLVLVHASKSGGGVIREPLAAFLKRNRTRGIAFASVRGGSE